MQLLRRLHVSHPGAPSRLCIRMVVSIHAWKCITMVVSGVQLLSAATSDDRSSRDSQPVHYLRWVILLDHWAYEFCNSLWCTNGRDNDYIIFQCNLPVHQYTSDICQKVLLFQSNRIPGACCRDTTPWPATAHHHRKTSFREGAVSDVEIGRSRWVPGRVSKVDETAAQNRCPSLWPVQLETCAPEHYVRQQRTSGQYSPPLLILCLTQICHHFTVVGSSHCWLLWYVIHQQHAFAIPENCGHDFPADGWVRNFLGGGEFTCFYCIDSWMVS